MTIVAVFVLNGCASETTLAPGVGGSYYLREHPSHELAIVFVHGVIGSSDTTWRNPKTGSYWPEMLAKDQAFATATIYVVEYPSPSRGRSLSIDELAERLRLDLEDSRVLTHRQLAFVSHSMGGLITRAYLLKYRKVATQVALLYFLSTPTEGSEIARVVKLFSRNPQFAHLVPSINDPESYLANQQRAWLAAGFSFLPSYCAYEGLPTYGVMVVSWQSAAALCTRRLDPIDQDHIGIAKPENNAAAAYRAFRAAYQAALRITINQALQKGWTLKQNITVLAEEAGWSEPNLASCDRRALSRVVMEGTIQASSYERLVEILGERLEGPGPIVRVRVTRREDGTHEISCH